MRGVPVGLVDVFSGPDRERARRAMKAMMGMQKLDCAKLEAAYRGDAAA